MLQTGRVLSERVLPMFETGRQLWWPEWIYACLNFIDLLVLFYYRKLWLVVSVIVIYFIKHILIVSGSYLGENQRSTNKTCCTCCMCDEISAIFIKGFELFKAFADTSYTERCRPPFNACVRVRVRTYACTNAVSEKDYYGICHIIIFC